MKITRQADYAIRVVLFLSEREPGEVVSVDDIARERLVPKSFASKIVQKLTKAGITRSFRGVKGGFSLAKPPGEITVLEVLETIDGPVAVNRCVVDDGACILSNECAVHPIWQRIQGEIRDKLSGITFRSLVSQNKPI